MTDSNEFWAGMERGELLIQACRECGRSQHFPRARCHFCNSTGLEYRQSGGRGRLITYSAVYRPPSPEFASLVPYTLGIVELDDERVHLMARILNDEDELELDAPVEADFVESPLGPLMPAFRLITD